MIRVDLEKLNPLERQIHATLTEYAVHADTIRISTAADLCNCSTSKISKFVNKLGLANYKQYLDLLYGRDIVTSQKSNTLARIEAFLQDYDVALATDLAELIKTKDKLVMLGYGPSHLCAQYFEYRFMTCTNRIAISSADEFLASSVLDDNSLLIIFSATGAFTSFDDICETAKAKGAEVVLLLEEYNPDIIKKFDRVICLSTSAQPGHCPPHEKTRTLFFIFMEEVLQEIMRARNEAVVQ